MHEKAFCEVHAGTGLECWGGPLDGRSIVPVADIDVMWALAWDGSRWVLTRSPNQLLARQLDQFRTAIDAATVAIDAGDAASVVQWLASADPGIGLTKDGAIGVAVLGWYIIEAAPAGGFRYRWEQEQRRTMRGQRA